LYAPKVIFQEIRFRSRSVPVRNTRIRLQHRGS